MKVGLFINDLSTEHPLYTTTGLALELLRGGHEAWYISATDFAYDPDDLIRAHARTAPNEAYEGPEELLAAVQGPDARQERISVDALDVLLLRNDPAVDIVDRPWAYNIGIIFGQLAVQHGVIVLNDPYGLAHAMNKLYFQQFPEEVRPRTLITRDPEDVKHFVHQLKEGAVLKPLQGSGGQNVFLVRKDDEKNLNQMIEAVSRDGYVVVQEYLTAAEAGDTRLFLLNCQPMRQEKKYAAIQRRRAKDDLRSNMHVGGAAAKAQITPEMLQIAEIVRPKLVRDGMFLVGLDIIGNKLMEINVFSPGGLYSVQKLTGVNFFSVLIGALERKVQYARFYHRTFDNRELATL